MWERATTARARAWRMRRTDMDTSGRRGLRAQGARARRSTPRCAARPTRRTRRCWGRGAASTRSAISDQCTSVLCATFDGRCVCNDDGDCGGDELLPDGVPGPGDNECVARKTDWDSCSRDGQCLSGACGGCANTVGWCYTPRSKAMGQTCKSDRECTTDRCSADCYMNPTGTCLCQSDAQCGTGQFCGWGTNSGKCITRGPAARCARRTASASPTTAAGPSPAGEPRGRGRG